ncbi:hypothetical protein K1T71_012089 [Dendrolimus kikuchii]|uniref:Uncharacterized protein n=1 Tax=Dendrolimus kikuchii TaxID=765133 RepID=A0ACC1CKZ8_9NEOP|nr:hypothetical protein K1T71_012089 [Dendrolimus kikuchii]
MVLALYKMDVSPPCRSVFMVIEALNIPNVKLIELDLLQDEHLKEDFLKINPQHTIPTLVDEDFVVWDSHAIATYLINKYESHSPLYPADARKRALVDLRLHFDSSILYPALREVDEPLLFWNEPSLKPEGLAKIKVAYDFTEKFLSTSTWLAGDDVTVADICCVATISSLNDLLPIDAAVYPNIIAWIGRCSKYDWYKKGNEPGAIGYRQLVKEYLERGKQ